MYIYIYIYLYMYKFMSSLALLDISHLSFQVYHDSEEGQRFTIYYPIKNFPNISIIDPRTGENVLPN